MSDVQYLTWFTIALVVWFLGFYGGQELPHEKTLVGSMSAAVFGICVVGFVVNLVKFIYHLS